MQITADTHDLKPPRPGRWLGPVGLALIAHALLMGALTWGVHWQKDEPLVSFEAELWSSVPREAAPRAVQPPPPPPPPPEPEPRPEPKPEPRPAPPPPPVVKEADIATAQAKKKAEAEKREEAKKVEAKRKAEALEKEKEKEAKKKAAEKLAQEKKTEERQEKLAEQKKQQEQERKAAERREEQLSAKLRADQMARMMGQVGASGSPDARGSAAQSSGPSSGYAGRVRERIRPNIRYSEEFPNSLRAEIEIRAQGDGTITSHRLVKSSGNSAWDDAALRAIDRTGSLPRDIDGRVPSTLIVVVRPLD